MSELTYELEPHLRVDLLGLLDAAAIPDPERVLRTIEPTLGAYMAQERAGAYLFGATVEREAWESGEADE